MITPYLHRPPIIDNCVIRLAEVVSLDISGQAVSQNFKNQTVLQPGRLR